MDINGVSQENFSLLSMEETPPAKLVDQARKISICFQNATGNGVLLNHVNLQGMDFPSSMELSAGESKIFSVSLNVDDDFIRKISYSYLLLQGSSAYGGRHALSLDLSKDHTVIRLAIYQEALYGDKGQYCGSVSRLCASTESR